MKNTLDLPKKYGAIEANMPSVASKERFSKFTVFLKENWIWILAGFTLLALVHTFWYFNQLGVEEFLRRHSEMLTAAKVNRSNAYNKSYEFGRLVGFWASIVLKSISGPISLFGATILLSEFNYQLLYKNLFVEEGRKGKFFYLIVLVFFYFFLLLFMSAIFADKLAPLGIARFLTNFWMLSMVVYSYFVYASESYHKIRDLALQKTKAELVALKAQINPHFLFNVLNNLYGQAIVEDSPKTASGIERLSRIMRHVVEETKTERSPIEKELKFVEDFIELQKMRIPDRPNIRLTTEVFWDGEPANIAPLLVIPFIENAFKYGISVNNESFFEMKLRVENKILLFESRNSIVKKADKLEMGTGTGLENTRKRLNLYYPGRYTLSLSSENEVFEVKMQVKL